MEYKQLFRRNDCWYKESCNYENCDVCIRYSEMRYLVDSSGIPTNKQYPEKLEADLDLDAFLELNDIKTNIVTFVEQGKNLYICSENTGNGKTTWAIKMMLKYFDEIWAGNTFRVRGVFIHVPTFLLQLKDFDNKLSDDYKKNIMNADLVIWDDICSAYLTDYDLAQLSSYFDIRTFNEKANILTGNITNDEKLLSMLGERIYSRVFSNAIKVKFIGKDRR